MYLYLKPAQKQQHRNTMQCKCRQLEMRPFYGLCWHAPSSTEMNYKLNVAHTYDTESIWVPIRRLVEDKIK